MKLTNKKILKKVYSQLSLVIDDLYDAKGEELASLGDKTTFYKKSAEALKIYFTRFERALKEVTEHFRLPPPENIEQLQNQLSDGLKLKQGETMQESLGFTNRLMEDIYGLGSDDFERLQYEEASDIFLFLSSLNPYVSTFWIALGRAEEQKEEIQSAQLAYMSALDTASNFDPALDVASCFVKLNQTNDAIAYLDNVIEEARLDGGQEVFINAALKKKSKL